MPISSQYTLKRNTDNSDSTGTIFYVSVNGYDEQTGEYSYVSYPIEGGLPSVDSLEWSYSRHVFKEWNTRSDGSGVSFSVGDYPPYDGDYDYESSSSTNLIYAIWEADPTYYIATDTELTSIADAIRTKGGTSASLEYPSEFVSAVNNIPTNEINFGVIRKDSALICVQERALDYLLVAGKGKNIPAYSEDETSIRSIESLSNFNPDFQNYNYFYTYQVLVYPIFNTQVLESGRPEYVAYTQVTELRGFNIVYPVHSDATWQYASHAFDSSSDNIYVYLGSNAYCGVYTNKTDCGLYIKPRFDTTYVSGSIAPRGPTLYFKGKSNRSYILSESAWNTITDFRIQVNGRLWKYQKSESDITDGWSHYMLLKNILAGAHSGTHTLTPPVVT